MFIAIPNLTDRDGVAICHSARTTAQHYTLAMGGTAFAKAKKLNHIQALSYDLDALHGGTSCNHVRQLSLVSRKDYFNT
jgi:hypothetical protein